MRRSILSYEDRKRYQDLEQDYPIPSIYRILRKRHHAINKGRAISFLGKLAVITIAGVALFLGCLGFVAGLYYARLVSDLPPVGNIEILYTETANGFPKPTQVYDRTGENLLFVMLHPAAAMRQWANVDPKGTNPVPQSSLQAIVAFREPSFWKNKGYDQEEFLGNLLQLLGKKGEQECPTTITQQLVEMTLLPADDWFRSPIVRFIKSAVLAERLTKRYSKEQILEWYLNSAYYGNLAYGIDAASLVYFGKHARDLTLAESALLAALPGAYEVNPTDSPQQASDIQRQVLVTMGEQGLITPAQRSAAMAESLPSVVEISSTSIFRLQRYTWHRLADAYGAGLANQYGMRVITSLDADLQEQLSCCAQVYIAGLEGNAPASTDDDWECEAASLLPPSRPGEEEKDHRAQNVAIVILNPRNGQLLGLYGAVDQPMQLQAMTYPFIYLTAFTRGYSPATMVLDLPMQEEAGNADQWAGDGEELHGPARIRIALLGAYRYAAQRMVQAMGEDAILRIMKQMGINSLPESGADMISRGVMDELEASLLDMSFAYGVFANEGEMAGTSAFEAESRSEWQGLDPILILRVEDENGKVLARSFAEQKAILSSELSFLVTDILSDRSTRGLVSSHSTPLEFDRPAAVMIDNPVGAEVNWTIGYSPSRVVGVWVGNGDTQGMEDADPLNGAASLWLALMQYASQQIIPEGWEKPEGVTMLEVCDPSGLLPTEACPLVVREYFLKGTEPVQYDDLYQPVVVHRETGKLATLLTPLEQQEERVFLVPPPEAAYWSENFGWSYPPQEYDPIHARLIEEAGVNIDSPMEFSFIHGKRWISGTADIENFEYYRLVYGEGLNPKAWYQIGEDRFEPVTDDLLAMWDTGDLNGLYSLQLMVIDQEGIVHIATRFIIVDNQPPQIEVLHPREGERYGEQGVPVRFEIRASDSFGLSEVEFMVDGQKVGKVYDEPFLLEMPSLSAGSHTFRAQAYDLAGNIGKSELVTLYVER
jgi:membrane carboxypeptidase/penicillin-binding protein